MSRPRQPRGPRSGGWTPRSRSRQMFQLAIGVRWALLHDLAREVCGVGRVAVAVVDRLLRERAQRPGERDQAGGVGGVRTDDPIGRDTVLHPLRQRREHVEVRGPRAAPAVPHARHHEEPREVHGAVEPGSAGPVVALAWWMFLGLLAGRVAWFLPERFDVATPRTSYRALISCVDRDASAMRSGDRIDRRSGRVDL